MRLPIALFLLLSSSFSHAAIMVTFNGILDGIVDNPFSGGDAYSGSFEIDETVMASQVATDSYIFSGAVDNFQLNVAGSMFTGENGLHRQTNSNNSSDLLGITVGGSEGSITGSVTNGPNYFLNSVRLDWRGQNLFTDSSVLASNLDETDITFRRVYLNFTNLSNNIAFSAIDSASQINIGTSAVPVPAAVWLFCSGLLGLLGFSRKKAS